ncbi:MAG: hypothetical protein R3304_01490 [Longimicrobiales bacterium]|nr:hypothetical protein [Longimicrobiales bacterium]
MSEPDGGTTVRDVLTLSLFFVVGTPMAYFIWHAFSDLLRGVLIPMDVGVAVVLLIVFFFLARAFGRTIHRMVDRSA